MNVGQQSWSSFQHKYGSDDFRKSTDFDKVSRAPGVVRSFLKKQSSSRKLPVTASEEKSRPGISRCSSTLNLRGSSKSKSLSSSLQVKHSQNSMSSERLVMSRRNSLSTCSSSQAQQIISDTSVSKNRNAIFQ